MHFLREVVEGLAGAWLRTPAYATALPSVGGNQESGRIDRLCRDLGWSVDERTSNTIRLHFKDPKAGVRKMYIGRPDANLVVFSVFSFAVLDADDVPDQVISYLLLRNDDVPIGAWSVSAPDEDDEVLFTFQYVALGSGLTAEVLSWLCESMIGEAIAFDEKLRGVNLLN